MNSVTLGGDRLGSGKKQKVYLHGYERSTHDLGYIFRSTMSPGTLVPFMVKVALPGDTFDIDLDADIKTHPTIGPLFGSYKVQLDIFLAPVRLYQGQLHNNKLGIGMKMSDVKLPLITLNAQEIDFDNVTDVDNAQINPSCILKYLGISGVGIPDEEERTRTFNAIPLLAYWDIYKNYYSNKQEEIGAVIHSQVAAVDQTIDDITIDGTVFTGTPIPLLVDTEIVIGYTGAEPSLLDIIVTVDGLGEISLDHLALTVDNSVPGTITIVYNWQDYGNHIWEDWRYRQATDIVELEPQIANFQLSLIDDMRERILAHAVNSTPFDVNAQNLAPYQWVLGQNGEFNNMMNSQEGLGLKTYQSDLFNNWLSTEWIDGAGGVSEVTAIDTSGGSFTIDTLVLSKKVYNMLNRIMVSGGTYDDWQSAVYDHQPVRKAESPMYMGGLIKELVFQEVVSNAENGDQPLGTLAGKGIMAKKHKGGHITAKVDEISYIIGIISLTPRIDYSQGNEWDVHLKTMDDFHKPALDEIGFQELITERMAWWDTSWQADDWFQKSAGKQPAWIEYMTSVNKAFGNFAVPSNEMFMTLNRRYEPQVTAGTHYEIVDLTTYIDPVKSNTIFANTAIDAQNFWAQVAVDITARRKMSAKVMPNL